MSVALIGWVGLILLMASYIILQTKYFKYFLLVDSVASFILGVHAIILKDLPFIIVNFFIAIMLLVKYYQESKK